MLKIRPLSCIIIFTLLIHTADGQRIKLIKGSLRGVKLEKSFAMDFRYDSMIVGRDTPEKIYLKDKHDQWDIKQIGQGENFVKYWFTDRIDLYQPTFIKEFEKSSRRRLNDPEAKYTLILKTKRTEGGWTAGIMANPAELDGELWVVESYDKAKVQAIIRFHSVLGKNSSGGDFDMTKRIQSAYAIVGKFMGQYFRRKSK